MMQHYYYPLCTKDFTFENIFASESISPPHFYSIRGFGIDYFYMLPKVHNTDLLILYNKPPKFETGTDNAAILKFILELNEQSLDTNEIITVDEGIIAYPKTIYFNRNNFNILFFSESDKKITCLKSETSLPTKGLKKFDDIFKVIDEEDCIEFNSTSVQSSELKNEKLIEEIAFDRLYNSFKGFVYGIAAALAGEKTKEEIHLKKNFQEIINRFAELKNRYENNSKGSSSKLTRQIGYQVNAVKSLEEKLIAAVESLENRFFELFPDEEFSEEDFLSFLISKYKKYLVSKEDAKRFLSYAALEDEMFGSNKMAKIKGNYFRLTGKKDPRPYFEILKAAGGSYTANSNFDDRIEKNNKENIDERFKNAIFELSKFTDEKFINRVQDKKIDLSPIQFNFFKNEIEIIPGFQSLTAGEMEEFLLITNSIFRSPKLSKGETSKEQILDIVEEIGNKTSKSKGGKQTHLYRYLNNEVSEYSIDKASSVVMKNFVAFIFNSNSFEKLENFIESKDIEKKWMSCSFWCVFNGFANISRNFLKPIFDTNNNFIQDYIDTYLQNTFQKSIDRIESLKEQERAIVQTENLPKTDVSNDLMNKRKEFFEKFISGKYEIGFEEFTTVTNHSDEEKAIKEIRTIIKITKKDAKKLIETYVDFMKSGILF